MHRVIALLALSVTTTTCLPGCTGQTPPPGERVARPVRVPPGCEQDQAGEYHHADNPAFRYLGEDDGGTLTLALVRAQDGATEASDGGTVAIVLSRTPDGFVGETRATGFSAAGTPCPVAFPTEVTACDPASLTLRSAASTAIGEDCRPAPSGPKPTRLQQTLVRGAPPSPADAGM
jgi:hypothetical protein